MKFDAIPFGWVDFVTAVVLFVGILRGRKRGLSEELLDTLQWIAIVIVSGLYYRTVAGFIAHPGLVGQTFTNVLSYLLIVALIKFLVTFTKKHVGEKIVGADLFGRGEYYLGMLAGMVRFTCIYLVVLSVIHAPFYTEQMLVEDAKAQQKNFGDIRFPTFGGVQHTFFKESATGWAAQNYLGDLLIAPAESQSNDLRNQNSLGKRREQTVDVLMGGGNDCQPDMAGLIAPATLEQIRAASDIVEVIGASVPLKKAGGNFIALCPFHREKTPSFSVNPHKQIFYCFGCQKGGDVFTFIREYEGLSFVEAVSRLADRAGIPLQFEHQPGQEQARHLKDALWQIHEQIARRWQTALANDAGGQVARDYLARRGVSPEAIQLFRLGYAPEAWDDTVNWARGKSYDLALVEQGLIIRKEGTDRHYDRFRGRLMFPICDEQGRVVAFSGRILSGDEKTAKYVNSPETPIFTKGKVFYGLDKSKRAILEAGCAVVCEGQLDLIASYMAGVMNIVGSQGTAFTSDHARILRRYVKEVVLCFDSDNAGQNAASRVLDSLLAADLAIRVAVVPAPHDPDSFIREKGAEAFRELIARAEGFFDFYLKRLCATNDLGADLGRKTVVQQMREALLKTGDGVLLDTYAQKTAQRLGVAADSVRAEFRKSGAPPRPVARAEPDETTASPAASPPSPHETQLLKLLLGSDEHVRRVAAHLRLEWLLHATVRRIVERRLRLEGEGGWRNLATFLGEFEEDQEAQSLIGACLAEERPIPNPGKQIDDILVSLRNQAIGREMSDLLRQLGHPELSEDRRLELLRRQQDLLQLKRQPLPPG